MHARRRAAAAHRVADDPAHGVAGRDRPGPHELLAFLKRDVRHLAGRGIDLIERAVRPGILLDGVEETVAHRLHAGGRVGGPDTAARIGGLGSRCPGRDRLQLAGERQGFGDRHHLDGAERFRGRRRRDLARRIIIANRGRLRRCGGAAGERGGGDKQDRRGGTAKWRVRHCDSSLDQFKALTKTPSGFLRRASGVRGGCTTMVRIADQRSVAARLPS